MTRDCLYMRTSIMLNRHTNSNFTRIGGRHIHPTHVGTRVLPPNSPSCPHGPRDAAGETPQRTHGMIDAREWKIQIQEGRDREVRRLVTGTRRRGGGRGGAGGALGSVPDTGCRSSFNDALYLSPCARHSALCPARQCARWHSLPQYRTRWHRLHLRSFRSSRARSAAHAPQWVRRSGVGGAAAVGEAWV